MTLLLEETSEAVESRPRVRKAVRWVPLVGKGVGRAGQAVWRAMRRSTRTRRRHMNSMTGLVPVTGSDHVVPSIPFWSVADAAAWQISTHPLLSMPAPASWLPAPLLQLLWPGQGAQLAADALRDTGNNSSITNRSSSSRASRRHEKRAAQQQRRAHKRHEKQLKRAQQQDNSGGPFSTSHSSSKSRAESVTGCASGFHAHVLAHMINTANTFPMLLQSAQHLQEQQQGQHNSSSSFARSSSPHTSSSDHGASSLQDQVPSSSSSSQVKGSTSSSSEKPRPQQLITVGCRHWGNAFVSGLLRVKIYDFAIYCDSHEAKAHMPLTPLKLQGPSSIQAPVQQQQQQAAGTDQDLPALLKSSNTPVEMSLVLKAAREVPLHLLAEEYEKVLRRRLDRVGGGPADVTALQQLLASFSDARRLPAAVTAGGGTKDADGSSTGGMSSASTGGTESDGQLPAAGAGAGGSVRKGAMIVFERRAGDVTARVGPVILGTVSSPKVAEALFDLYLGEQPVSQSAKEAAAQTLQRIAAAPAAVAADTGVAAGRGSLGEGVQPQQRQDRLGTQQRQQSAAAAAHYLPMNKGHEIRCEDGGAAGRQGRRARRKKSKAAAGSKDGQHAAVARGLQIDDLEACVLHMG